MRAALGRASELKEATVLALGGGTYAQPGCPEFLRSAGIPVLWLDSPIELLLSRCMTMTGRPLFRDEGSFRALHAQRLTSYQLADYRVDSSGDPTQVVAEILRPRDCAWQVAAKHISSSKNQILKQAFVRIVFGDSLLHKFSCCTSQSAAKGVSWRTQIPGPGPHSLSPSASR